MFTYLTSTNLPLWNPVMLEGEQDLFATCNVSPTDLFEAFRKNAVEPGDAFVTQENIYQCVQLRGSTGATGDLVKLYANNAARVATITAATKDLLTMSGAAFTADELVGKFVYVKTGTGIGQVRRILANDATTIRVSRYFGPLQVAAASAGPAFDTTPAVNDTVVIVGYDEVEKTAAATDRVQGVIVATAVTQNNYTVIKLTGPALVKMVGSTDAVTALGPLVPSGTAGIAKGFTTAGETAADARLQFGTSFVAYSGAAQVHLAHLYGNHAMVACASKIRQQ